MSQKEGIKVHIEFGETQADFEGSPSEVIRAIMKFVETVYPAFATVKNLSLTIETEQLARNSAGIIGFGSEGAVIIIPKDRLSKLSIRELIALHLVKAYLARTLGKSDRDSQSVDELLTAIGGRIGAMAGRLSEMVDEGLVARIGRGEYKITTFGLKQYLEQMLPRIVEHTKQ